MPMAPYPVICYAPECRRIAVYKVAARWSDGTTGELKTYSLSCPGCYVENSSPARNMAEDRPMAGKKTILIVDDDDALIDGLRLLLEKQGYAILQANDGHKGKQIIVSQKPDLVIVDMMMPRLGGYPLL